MRRAPVAVAAAVGSIALSAALSGAAPAPSASPAAGSARPVVLISPDLRHVAQAQPAPPTTAFCEKHYGIACYRPIQVQRAYQLPSSTAGALPARARRS